MRMDVLTDHLPGLILKCLDEGVITVDASGAILSLNPAAEAMTGLRLSQVRGSFCADVFAPVCGGVCAIAETLRSKRAQRELPVRMPDRGQLRELRLSTALLRHRGRVLGAVGLLRDVSTEVELRRALDGTRRFSDIIGAAPALRRLLDELPAIAASPSTVLLEGESGTGKEVVARALHAHGAQALGPFVAVNCGALPESLLEAELFGVVKGAYTGADRDRPGRIRSAEGGTLFLDEVGEMPPSLQVRLLRVLQERVVEPLGSSEQIPVQIRVIAATNRDLRREISVGRFRLDLYYRLAVIPLRLPPLRQRIEDLPLLARHFVDRFNRLQGRQVPGLTQQALAVCASHSWPGNIRELEHAIERAFVRCAEGPIQPEHLDLENLGSASIKDDAGIEGNPLLQAEAQALRTALAEHQGNRSATARTLGMHRVTLQRKLRRLGII